MRCNVYISKYRVNYDDYLQIVSITRPEDVGSVEVGWTHRLNVTIYPPRKTIQPFFKSFEIESSAYGSYFINQSDAQLMRWNKVKEYVDRKKLFIEIDIRIGGPLKIPNEMPYEHLKNLAVDVK